MFTPGIRYDLPFPEYLAIEALSSSGARTILRSPAHYVEARTNPDPATPDLMFGSAVHVGVLEPLRFATDVLVMPSFNRRTNAGKEDAAAWEAANAGRLAFDAETFERIHRCIGAIRNHDGAMTILSRATCEVTMQWVDPATGVPCKARIDARRPDAVLGDLKTTQDASPAAFARLLRQRRRAGRLVAGEAVNRGQRGASPRVQYHLRGRTSMTAPSTPTSKSCAAFDLSAFASPSSLKSPTAASG